MSSTGGNAPIEAEDSGAQSDSAYGDDYSSYTSSISSSVKDYQYENGRRYHNYRQGQYILPNDETEQDRLDLSHHIYLLLLEGSLFRAPVKEPKRVLDLGTGTGIWAIDFADTFPDAEVVGNDLSPIQPSWVPPNCKFEVDDFEADWPYQKNFSFIHARELDGSIRDRSRLFSQALEHLEPGGYFEMQSIMINGYSDDDSRARAVNVRESAKGVHDASRLFGKPIETGDKWKGEMEAIGFKNVVEETFTLPLGPWPKDKKLKELGRFHQINSIQGIDAYTMALFTRVLGWEKQAVVDLVDNAKKELRDPTIHLYTKVYFVYGQKEGGS